MIDSTTHLQAQALSANERLVLSREQMRRFLRGQGTAGQEPPGQSRADAGAGLGHAGRVSLLAAHLALAPTARRHPWPLVGAAMLAGGLLAWSRPWRWLLRPALFAGIAAQLTSHVVARLPLDRLVDAAITLFVPRPPARNTTTTTPPSAPASQP